MTDTQHHSGFVGSIASIDPEKNFSPISPRNNFVKSEIIRNPPTCLDADHHPEVSGRLWGSRYKFNDLSILMKRGGLSSENKHTTNQTSS